MSLKSLFIAGAMSAAVFGAVSHVNIEETLGQNSETASVAVTQGLFGVSSAYAADFKAKSVDTTDYGDALIVGDPDAPVTLLEFSSLTCPHCAAFHREKWPDIKKKYIDTGMVKLAYKDFPFDQRAAGAAMLARCVGDKRRYKAIDILFKTQQNWSRSNDYIGELKKVGKLAGLSGDKVDQCLENDDVIQQVLEDLKEGQEKWEVRSTPTFFINGEEKIEGNISLDEMTSKLDDYFE